MIIVDSNVWIFAEIATTPEHPAATRAIETNLNAGHIATNVVIASEVYHKLAKTFGQMEARRRLDNVAFHPEVHWLDFSRNVAKAGTATAQSSGIRINDALIAAQALHVGCAVLTDNVKDFKKVPRLRIVPLRG